ncbi:MAG: hypothetical protein Ta2B_02990 [Termitinemataceae bacterium]|nr:MAG: hypothetical protein Ta2B_02990 [Termitinemataceae bacterium]
MIDDTVCSAISCIQKNDVIIVAVSGGADSTALFVSLCNMQKKIGYKLNVLHINHNLRDAESDADADFVKRLCADFSVPCNVVTIAKGLIERAAKENGCGVEAAARLERRHAFAEEASRLNASYILTAHTKNDAAETILMRLLRGAGPRGLAGIRAAPYLSAANRTVRLLRPFLTLWRSDIEAYLTKRNLQWQTDSTNSSDVYLRNKIRLHLIPVLNKHFPHWVEALLCTAETQNLVANYIEKQAAQMPAAKNIFGKVFFDVLDFFAADEIVREEAVFKALDLLPQRSEAISLDTASKNTATDFVADPSTREKSPPRRKTVRDFCSGKTKNAALGAFKIWNDGCSVCAAPQDCDTEHGFSLSLKEGDKCKIDGLSIECVSVHGKSVRIVLRSIC